MPSRSAPGAITSLDPRFTALVAPDAQLERLWTGGIWTEGPAWRPRHGDLVWSDIPNNRMLRWQAATGQVDTFRQPANGANGNTVDQEGRLITCEQYSRRITRTEDNGAVTVLVDRFEGHRFNAPNDVVVARDGAIWFTDPDYGRSDAYEGERELQGCHVYRYDPLDGTTRQVTTDFVMPNGLAFSPDETLLYIIDTGSTHLAGGPNHMRRFRVGPKATLSGGEVILADPNLFLDGFRVDVAGHLWCGAGDGVDCYAPDGTLIGKIATPERVSNVTFGDATGTDLFLCATSAVFRLPLTIRGAHL